MDLSAATTEELQAELTARGVAADPPADQSSAPAVDVTALTQERDNLQAQVNPLNARLAEVEAELAAANPA
jgi:uncharacterized protein involved in exopolysaccharide biosynthesis